MYAAYFPSWSLVHSDRGGLVFQVKQKNHATGYQEQQRRKPVCKNVSSNRFLFLFKVDPHEEINWEKNPTLTSTTSIFSGVFKTKQAYSGILEGISQGIPLTETWDSYSQSGKENNWNLDPRTTAAGPSSRIQHHKNYNTTDSNKA